MEMFEKLFKHNITKRDGQPYCGLCMSVLPNWEDAIYHIQDNQSKENHKICKKNHKICSPQLLVELEICSHENYEVLVNNGIIRANQLTYLRYTPWSEYFSSMDDILLQIKGNCLNNNVLVFDIKNLQRDTKETNTEHMKQTDCSKRNTQKEKFAVLDRNLACDAKDDAMIQEIHKLNNSKQRLQFDWDNKIIIIEQFYLKCIVCEKNFPSLNNAFQHINGKKHRRALKNKVKQRVECTKTKEVKASISVQSEVNTGKGKPEDQGISLISTDTLSNSTEQEIQLLRNNELLALGQIHLKCTICERSYQSLYDMLYHINAKDHNSNLKDDIMKEEMDSVNTEDVKESVSVQSASSMQTRKLAMPETKKTEQKENVPPTCANILNNNTEQEIQILRDSKLIAFGQMSLKCIVCERLFQSVQNILQHIKKNNHKNVFNKGIMKQEMDSAKTENIKETVALHPECSMFKGKSDFSETKRAEQKQDPSETSTNILNNSLEQEIQLSQDNKIITLGLRDLKCTVCEKSFHSQHDIFHHFKGKRHKSMLMNTVITKQQTRNAHQNQGVFQTSSSILQNNLEQEFHLLQDSTITMVGTHLECSVCKRGFPSVHDTLQHIIGEYHINKLQSKFTNVEIASNKDINNSETVDSKINTKDEKLCLAETQNTFQKTSITLLQETDTETHRLHNSNSRTNYGSNKSLVFMGTLNSDNVTPNIESSLGNTDKTKYSMQDINTCKNDKYSQNVITIQEDFYYCGVCNLQSNISNLIQHMADVSHISKESSMELMKDNQILFKCFCCKSIIPGCNQLRNHLRLKQHFENLKSVLCYMKGDNGNTAEIATSMAHITLKDKTRFPLYTAIASKVEDRSTRFTEQLIISCYALHTKFATNVEKHILYYCAVCKATIGKNHNLIQHCCGKRHMSTLIKLLFSSSKRLQEGDSASDLFPDPDDSRVETSLVAKLATLSIGGSDSKAECVKTVPSPHKEDSVSIETRCDDHTIQTGSTLIIPKEVHDDVRKYLCMSPVRHTLNIAKSHERDHQTLPKRLNKPCSLRYFELIDKIYSNNTAELLRLKSTYKVFVPQTKNSFYCLACNEIVSNEIQTLYEHLHNINHEHKVCLMENDDSKNQLLGEYMKRMSENWIKCYPCKRPIDDPKKILAHVSSSLHKTKHAELKKKIDDTFSSMFKEIDTRWYSIYRFCCIPCNSSFNYNIEFMEHVSKVHNKDGDSCKFDFCTPCATLWLCYKDSYGMHCSANMHKYLVKTKFFAIKSLPQCVEKLLMNVDKTLNNLIQLTEDVFMNDETPKKVKRSLNNSLRAMYPNLKVSFFGSRVTGLGFLDSDLDIYLDCGICETAVNSRTHLVQIAQVLQKQKDQWMVKEVVSQSRTPIIKSKYISTGVECDISITSKRGYRNSKFIRSFNDVYPLGRKLILFLKKWLQYCDLPGTHGITSFTLVWLVLFYLQVKVHFPSYSELLESENIFKCVNDWKSDIASSQNKLASTESVSKSLLGFFDYYANFNYMDNIVCPLMGCELSKKAFVKPDKLPKEMAAYVSDLQKSKKPEYFRTDSPLCVQDPSDLSHNLTKAVQTVTLKAFKQFCRDSANILSSMNV